MVNTIDIKQTGYCTCRYLQIKEDLKLIIIGTVAPPDISLHHIKYNPGTQKKSVSRTHSFRWVCPNYIMGFQLNFQFFKKDQKKKNQLNFQLKVTVGSWE